MRSRSRAAIQVHGSPRRITQVQVVSATCFSRAPKLMVTCTRGEPLSTKAYSIVREFFRYRLPLADQVLQTVIQVNFRECKVFTPGQACAVRVGRGAAGDGSGDRGAVSKKGCSGTSVTEGPCLLSSQGRKCQACAYPAPPVANKRPFNSLKYIRFIFWAEKLSPVSDKTRHSSQ